MTSVVVILPDLASVVMRVMAAPRSRKLPAHFVSGDWANLVNSSNACLLKRDFVPVFWVMRFSSNSMLGGMSSFRSARLGSLNDQRLIRAKRSSRNFPWDTSLSRSRLVPQMSWKFDLASVSAPRGRKRLSSMARRSMACSSGPSSPISSRKSKPLFACLSKPGRSADAPVKAPFL